MENLLDHRTTKIVSSTSPLSFSSMGSGDWEVWDRFISVEGSNIYHIGNVCDTCFFFFEKLIDLEKSINPKETIIKLNTGLKNIEDETVDILREIIPNGYYEIVLGKISPKQIEVGKKQDYFANEQGELWTIGGKENNHSPKVDYYRGNDLEIGDDRKLFEFFIPITSTQSINNERVEFYKRAIKNGNRPTAVSLTVLDIKEPAMWPEYDIKPAYTSHWCLAHYIIDGHHKIKAASDLNSEITLLSFIATKEGISNVEDIDELLRLKGRRDKNYH